MRALAELSRRVIINRFTQSVLKSRPLKKIGAEQVGLLLLEFYAS